MEGDREREIVLAQSMGVEATVSDQVTFFIHLSLCPSVCLSRVLQGSSLVERRAAQNFR